ncbi:larval/pupal cuticle protein H1C-like [Teleopsis dalmanni]|uniref:larval/pupal cuticle protein H1C-like n=1 Tax=Teleopsis dalmanni TaxID=139649 RepID=UPI0018CE2858|nr:larval/pupal cuticle protein H1C-like [Teleopsis dalmanni]
MFRLFVVCALISIAAANPGFVQPVVAKVGAVVHSAPSAVSHQSFTQVHSEAHVVSPIVKTIAAPIVPVVKTVATPVIHTQYVAAPVIKTVAPVVPVVKTYAPVVPVLKAVSAPISYQSHNQVHLRKPVIAPIIASVPVVHAAHFVH